MFARHPTDCDKYIRCNLDGKLLQIVQCPGYLVFNIELSLCDQAYKIDCSTGFEITTTTISPALKTTESTNTDTIGKLIINKLNYNTMNASL
jgi:hypothetical protein